MPVTLKKCKPHVNPAPYKPQQSAKHVNKDAPKTSAQPVKKKGHKNLTLHDWMTVFAWMDTHPNKSQTAIVQHFATHVEGTLAFDQSTLSHKLRDRPKLELHVNQTPNALSSKQPHAVMHPDVEEALVLWTKHMEEKGKTVNSAMLVTKWQIFEERFNVPNEEQLKGNHWHRGCCPIISPI